MIEIMERLGWTVPEGHDPRRAVICKRCTHDILWCRAGGKWVPLNRDGSRHPWNCRAPMIRPSVVESTEPCLYCPPESMVRYSLIEMQLHLDARHPIARTLPRSGPGDR